MAQFYSDFKNLGKQYSDQIQILSVVVHAERKYVNTHRKHSTRKHFILVKECISEMI